MTAKAAHTLYRKPAAVTGFHYVDGRGHSLTIDHGWREIPDTALARMAQRDVTETV